MAKILIVTTVFPFECAGACEQDRASGIRLLQELGYEVEVICRAYKRHLSITEEAERNFGIHITPVLYAKEIDTPLVTFMKQIMRLFYPPYWDGASFEYRDHRIRKALSERIDAFKPDIVWFDYTYLWPLYTIVEKRKKPIVTRSCNFEADHFYGKTNKGLIDWIKYQIKILGERYMFLHSNLLFAITPKEKIRYEQFGTTPVVTLPLRRLHALIGKNATVHDRAKLNVYLAGANFTVDHMEQALDFVVNTINPLLQKTYPDTFTIHIIGKKVPERIAKKTYPNVLFHGFVPDLDAFLSDMDIALSPSLSGAGMQQKVFEPIVRGIPTVTSERALVGYPFYNHIHVLTTENTAASFVKALGSLIPFEQRKNISARAVILSQTIFSHELMKEAIDTNIKHYCL